MRSPWRKVCTLTDLALRTGRRARFKARDYGVIKMVASNEPILLSKDCLYLPATQFGRMATIIRHDKAPHPMQVDALDRQALLLYPQPAPNVVEKPPRRARPRHIG